MDLRKFYSFIFTKFVNMGVSGNANRQHVLTHTVDNLTTILTDFTNNLSIFEPNNLTKNK